MQRGTIYKHNGAWFVRFYDIQHENGQRKTKRVAKKLAAIDAEHKTKASVQGLANDILKPINTKALAPESSMLITEFIEHHYFPAAEQRLRPSTVKDYKEIFKRHLESRLGDIRLRDFRTVNGQRIMRSIPDLSHERLLRIRAVLSAVFTFAAQEGVLDGIVNPMHAVKVPGRPSHFKGKVYSVDDIETILLQLHSVPIARTVIACAAFSGLRLNELRGLRWEDFDGDNLHVKRTIWRTIVGPTKTAEAEASVPVLPILKRILEAHKKTTKYSSQTDYIFAGERRGTSLNLMNLALRVIIPSLKRCSACHKKKSEHSKEKHEFDLDKNIPEWRGWHSFRRGLASNLYSLDVTPKVIQAILRHADIGTTLQFYVKTNPSESRDAMQRLESKFLWVV